MPGFRGLLVIKGGPTALFSIRNVYSQLHVAVDFGSGRALAKQTAWQT